MRPAVRCDNRDNYGSGEGWAGRGTPYGLGPTGACRRRRTIAADAASPHPTGVAATVASAPPTGRPSRPLPIPPAPDVYDEGTYVLTYGQGVTKRGKYINAWKPVDGRWRVQANIWNTDPTDSTATPSGDVP